MRKRLLLLLLLVVLGIAVWSSIQLCGTPPSAVAPGAADAAAATSPADLAAPDRVEAPDRAPDRPAPDARAAVAREEHAAQTAEEPEPTVDPIHTRIVGRVVDPSGRPVREVGVCVKVEPTMQGINATRRMTLTSLECEDTDEEGRFELTRIPAHGALVELDIDYLGGNWPVVMTVEPVPGGTLDLGDVILGARASVAGHVLDETGRPIPEARIQSTPVLPAPFDRLQHDLRATYVADTEKDGTFAGWVSPGTIVLSVGHPEYLPAWSEPLNAVSGQSLSGVDITLSRGVSLAGKIVSGDGRPLNALWAEAVPEDGGPVAIARPSERGEFEFGGKGSTGSLRPGGTYRVMALGPPDYDYFDSDPLVVRVPESPESVLEPIVLTMQACPLIRLEVRDATSQAPIPDAFIAWTGTEGFYLRGGVERSPLGVDDTRAFFRTDSEGKRAFYLTERNSTLTIGADGFAPQRVDPWVHTSDTMATEIDLLVELVGGATLRVDVLGSGGPVQGATVELRGSRPERAPGFLMRPLQPSPRNHSRPFYARATSGDDGVAAFDHLPPGLYSVVGEAEGHARTLGPEFEIVEGQTDASLQLHLPLEAAVFGTVTALGGTAPPQEVVAVLEDEDFVYGTRTAADGSYRLGGLPPGAYAIHARLPPSPSLIDRLLEGNPQMDASRVAKVVLAEGDELELDLEGELEGVTVAGVVEINGEARAGMEIHCRLVETTGDPLAYWRALLNPSTTTDGQGRFELAGLQPGRWEVYATPPFFARTGPVKLLEQEVRLDAGAPPELWLRASTAPLEVQVKAPAEGGGHEDAGRCRVDLRPDPDRGGVPGLDDDERWVFFTNDAGRLLVPDLAQGAYLLKVMGKDLAPHEGNVTLGPVAPGLLTIEMQPKEPATQGS